MSNYTTNLLPVIKYTNEIKASLGLGSQYFSNVYCHRSFEVLPERIATVITKWNDDTIVNNKEERSWDSLTCHGTERQFRKQSLKCTKENQEYELHYKKLALEFSFESPQQTT